MNNNKLSYPFKGHKYKYSTLINYETINISLHVNTHQPNYYTAVQLLLA